MSLELIKKYAIKAKKFLGQNFLVNDDILEDIISFIKIKGQNVIEVGPGYGALTQKILNHKPKSLTLVELDKDMIDIIEERVKNLELNTTEINFSIKNKDILKFVPNSDNYLVIANIPYYITSPILRHFLYKVKNKPKEMLILMQKDVGDKICGKGKNKASVLSLFIAKKCRVKEVLFVGKENFIPVPKVESSILSFKLHSLYKDIDDDIFLDIIKKGFLSPRKKLVKNLASSGFKKGDILDIFTKLSIKENIRGEDLNIETWCSLVKILEGKK